MSRIRIDVRGSRRLAALGVAATTASLLAAALSPAAVADEQPTRAGAIANAASALLAHAASLGLTSAEGMAPTHPPPPAAGSTTAQRLTGPFAAMVDKVRDAFSA